MGRIYTVILGDTAVSAAKTLVELSAASNQPIEIVGIEIGQSTDAGDAQDELLRLSLVRGAATTGTGTAATPSPMQPNDAASDFTAKVNMTAEATAGSEVTIWNTCWNVRAGYINWFPEGMRPTTVNGALLALKQSLPADAITMNVTLWVHELA